MVERHFQPKRTPSIIEEIIRILGTLEAFQIERNRPTLLTEVFPGHPRLVASIDNSGSTSVFLTNLLSKLDNFGSIEGEEAICILLRHVRTLLASSDLERECRVLVEILGGVVSHYTPTEAFNIRLQSLTAPGGAVSLDSQFYISRPEEKIICTYAERDRAIVTIRSPRQTGKSTLLGVAQERIRNEGGVRVVALDLQSLTTDDLLSANALWKAIASAILESLNMDEESLVKIWREERPTRINVRRLLTHIFAYDESPLLLCLDECDRLMGHERQQDFFPLVRSFFNAGASDDHWRRIRWLLVASTEPSLFITGAESPFNIGEASRVHLPDFNHDQIALLAQAFGFAREADILAAKLDPYLKGRPYLVHLWLWQRVMGKTEKQLMDAESAGGGAFREHLERFLAFMNEDSALKEAMRRCLNMKGAPEGDREAKRLEGAGIVAFDGTAYYPACELYSRYFHDKLR